MLIVQLLLISYLLQEAICSPPLHPPIVDKGKKRAPRRPRPELSANLDLESLPLKDLVGMRPTGRFSPQGLLYQTYFVNHPDVRKIDLHDSEPANTAQALLDLSAKGTKKEWKSSMAASIRNYIEAAPFENEAKREYLHSLLKGMRQEAGQRARSGRYRARGIPRVSRKGKKPVDSGEQEQAGPSHQERGQKLPKEDPLVNLPLSYHLKKLGRRLTAMEAEEEARKVDRWYTNKAVLTKELEKYLRDIKVSPKDFKTAMAMRASTVYQARRERATQRRKLKVASASTSSYWTPSSFEASQSAANGVPSSSGTQQQHQERAIHLPQPLRTPPLSPSGGQLNTNDPKQWKWLEGFLFDDSSQSP